MKRERENEESDSDKLVKQKSKPVKTLFKENVVDPEIASYLYEWLKNNTKWGEAVRSRIKGFTRKGQHYTFGTKDIVDSVIVNTINVMTAEKDEVKHYECDEIFLNYYESGKMWCQNHSHKGSHQVVISLGATRQLHVGKKIFKMTNGSACFFGSAVHGVPVENDVIEGRISIAIFLTKKNKVIK